MVSVTLTDDEVAAAKAAVRAGGPERQGTGSRSGPESQQVGVGSGRLSVPQQLRSGEQSLLVRGLAVRDPDGSVHVSAYVCALVRAVGTAERRVEVRVDLYGDQIGAAAPYLDIVGPDSCGLWTAVSHTGAGLHLFETITSDEVADVVAEAVGAVYDQPSEASRDHAAPATGSEGTGLLRLFLTSTLGGAPVSYRVEPGTVLAGTVRGRGRAAAFRGTEPVPGWSADLLYEAAPRFVV